MSNPAAICPRRVRRGAFDAVTDLCGEPIAASLRAFVAGNQYMVMPALVDDGDDAGVFESPDAPIARTPNWKSVRASTLKGGIDY